MIAQMTDAVPRSSKLTVNAKLTHALKHSMRGSKSSASSSELLANNMGSGKCSTVHYIDDLRTKSVVHIPQHRSFNSNLYDMPADQVD